MCRVMLINEIHVNSDRSGRYLNIPEGGELKLKSGLFTL